MTHLQDCPSPKTISQLRRFLGMLNFYRRFLPQAAVTQAPLHDVLSGPRVKGSHPIAWTPELHKAFEECKESLSRATLLTHPDPSAQLALVTDASTTIMGAVLQQRVNSAWQPLAFFSKMLNSAQQKYSAYDREPLAIYEAVKYFRHKLEARHFIIFKDHKPITYAFQQKRDSAHHGNSTTSISLLNLRQTYDTYQDRTTLSPTHTPASNPSLRHHRTKHCPQHKTMTKNFGHFSRRTTPYG
jgi:hypothetical protein